MDDGERPAEKETRGGRKRFVVRSRMGSRAFHRGYASVIAIGVAALAAAAIYSLSTNLFLAGSDRATVLTAPASSHANAPNLLQVQIATQRVSPADRKLAVVWHVFAPPLQEARAATVRHEPVVSRYTRGRRSRYRQRGCISARHLSVGHRVGGRSPSGRRARRSERAPHQRSRCHSNETSAGGHVSRRVE